MKHGISSFVLAALCASATGATFSGNGGAGSSTIPGDYPSLAAAAADFSNSATAVSGDYTFFIAGDLTEPDNVAFGKETGANTVRIRPLAGTTPTITFTSVTSLASNAGFNGHLVIGTTSTLNSLDRMTSTSNFIIDGWDGTGAVTRDLTIRNTVAETTIGQMVVQIVGACDNVQLRNATLIGDRTTTALIEQIVVEVNSRRVSGVNYQPSNVTIDNCDIRAPNAYNGQAVVCRNNGTLNAGSAQANMRITSNTMTTTHRSVFLGCNFSTLIENNTFSVKSKDGWIRTPDVINHSGTGSNGANGWVMTINNNRFVEFENPTPGTANTSTGGGFASMLFLGGGTTAGTYQIFNNTFGGFNYNSPPVTNANNAVYRCICQQSGNSPSVINVYHNSFNMPNFPHISGQGQYFRYNAVSVPVAVFNGTLNVYNNIFRFEQNNGVVFHRGTGGTGTFNSDYNVFHLGSTGRMAWYQGASTAAPTHATLAQWKATGRDLHSREVNMLAGDPPATGKWVSQTDLHFDADPGDGYAGTPKGIAWDMDYEPRSATVPYIGADERAAVLAQPTGAQDWALFP